MIELQTSGKKGRENVPGQQLKITGVGSRLFCVVMMMLSDLQLEAFRRVRQGRRLSLDVYTLRDAISTTI